MKKYPIKSCFDCPNKSEYGKDLRCDAVKHRKRNPRLLHNTDLFLYANFNEIKVAVSTKYPDWCPLENY